MDKREFKIVMSGQFPTLAMFLSICFKLAKIKSLKLYKVFNGTKRGWVESLFWYLLSHFVTFVSWLILFPFANV